jgi:hypothetical protein
LIIAIPQEQSEVCYVATATKAWDYLKIVLREWLKQLSILMKIKSDQLTEFHQKIVATWTSCMAFMLQGQLQLVTIGHVITALKVSVASGLVYLLLAPLLRIYKSWEQALLLVGIVTIIDWQVHPSHFGGEFSEPVDLALS